MFSATDLEIKDFNLSVCLDQFTNKIQSFIWIGYRKKYLVFSNLF